MYVAQTSFASGEISDRAHARIEVENISESCRTLTNAELGRLGSAKRRRGWKKLAAAQHSSSAFLAPMRLRGRGEYMLEFATNGIHVHADGAAAIEQVIASPPWTEAELKELQYAQHGDKLFLAHHDHEPRYVEKIGSTWTLKKLDTRNTGPQIDPKRKRVPVVFIFKAAGVAGKDFLDAAEDTFRNSDVDTTATGAIWRVSKYWLKTTKFLNARRLDVTLLGGVAASEKKELLDNALFDWCGPWKHDALFENLAGGNRFTIDQTVGPGERVTISTTHSSATDDARVGQVLSLWDPSAEGGVLVVMHNQTGTGIECTCIHGGLTAGAVYADARWYALQDRHTPAEGVSLQAEPEPSVGSDIKITASPYPGTSSFPSVFDASMLSDLPNHAGAVLYMNGGAYRVTAVENGYNATVNVIQGSKPSHSYPTTDWSFGWSKHSGYPRTVAVHQRRLCFGGVDQFPHRIYASETENPFNYGSDVTSSSPLTLSMAAETGGGVNWMRSTGRDLLVGSEDHEIAVGGLPLSPSEVGVDVQSTWGSRNRQAVMAGPLTCFVSRDGRGVRGMSFRFETERWESPELSELSDHLFSSSTQRVKQLSYAGSPESRLYALREDGTIACLTIRQDTGVRGWSQWTNPTGDSVIAIAVRRPFVDGEDELWGIVSRQGTRYVERLVTGAWLDHQENVTQASSTTVTVSSLANRVVQAVSLTTGDYLGQHTANGSGSITVSPAQVSVAVGLPFTFTVEGYRPEGSDRSIGATVGRRRNYSACRVQLFSSKGAATAGGRQLLLVGEGAVSGWRDVVGIGQGGDSGDADLAIAHDAPYEFEVTAVSLGVGYGGS